jgi:hypothetical protein
MEVVVQHTHQQQPHQTMDADRQAGPMINGVMMKTIMPNVIGTAELAVTITMLVGTTIA